MKLITEIAIAFFWCFGGSPTPVKEVGGPELIANRTSDTLDCMIYLGSDDTFYYFDRKKFKTVTHFKVRREEVELPPTLRVGEIPIGMRVKNATTWPAH